MLSCNCLNVMIETKPDDFQKVTIESLNLTEECKDEFFKQEFQQVGKLININKTHLGLIQIRNVGSWIINQCVNCDVNTHALHRDKGASCVLVNSKLLTGDEITKLKNSDLYSSVFHIIVFPTGLDDNIVDDVHLDPYMPKETLNYVKNVKEMTTETLKTESLAVEERIRKFAEEQYNALEHLKDKTFKEQEALIRVILSKIPATTQVPDFPQMVSPATNSEPKVESLSHKKFNFKISNENMKASARHAPQRQKSSPGLQNPRDAEILFDFDGVDMDNADDDGGAIEEVDETDEDDVEIQTDNSVEVGTESVMVPRGKQSNYGVVAKSLPVNIPVFMSQLSSHENEDIDDKLHADESVDIAASIKALAQSVHGDAIFGDLPRPRFSTQI